ncbi:hypothetical protein [Rubrolithibacter danxiaensis]|uniref:hypothetical protein n=1 Tax=Rubrolithibacter danxiaensis TaxID=3390805 RepID=UPI003BF8ADE9
MKKLLTIIFGLLTITSFGQTIDLKWKIGEKEKINYLTVMSDIDTSKVEMDFGNFFKSFSDSTGKGLSETKDIFKKLNQSMQNIDFVSTLSNKGDGIIDIVMTTRPKEKSKENSKDSKDSKEDEMLKMMQSMNQGVMLRGSVYATGGIHSFWVKSNQKNLISTFFELPTKPLKIGDTWKIDINLIANDQNFSCDSSYKINEVTLTDIKKNNGETIAVIKYNIVEYVNGTFNSPSFMGGGGEQKTMMKFTHQAIAEFSVDKGRWISYDGIMSLDATGVMTAKKKTKFTLISE